MQGYNLIVVFSEDRTKMLMCRRLKEPYMGLYNFVGGKIEKGEDGIDAAYRELWEETAVTRDDIVRRISWISRITLTSVMLRYTRVG